MTLTIEEQHKLTEFLGECWHEWMIEDIQGLPRYACRACLYETYAHPTRLDFADWRVVGRLAVKAGGVDLEEDEGSWMCAVNKPGAPYVTYDAPEEAICRAVLAYLGGKS